MKAIQNKIGDLKINVAITKLLVISNVVSDDMMCPVITSTKRFLWWTSWLVDEVKK